jgi:hypothetical protein
MLASFPAWVRWAARLITRSHCYTAFQAWARLLFDVPSLWADISLYMQKCGPETSQEMYLHSDCSRGSTCETSPLSWWFAFVSLMPTRVSNSVIMSGWRSEWMMMPCWLCFHTYCSHMTHSKVSQAHCPVSKELTARLLCNHLFLTK